MTHPTRLSPLTLLRLRQMDAWMEMSVASTSESAAAKMRIRRKCACGCGHLLPKSKNHRSVRRMYWTRECRERVDSARRKERSSLRSRGQPMKKIKA